MIAASQDAAMIRSLFVSMQELNKGARRPPAEPPSALKTVGIVGAGFMGAGIAQVTAAAGLNVVLIDRDQETADKGKSKIMVAQAEADHKVAVEKCEALTGPAQKECKDNADRALDQARETAKANR